MLRTLSCLIALFSVGPLLMGCDRPIDRRQVEEVEQEPVDDAVEIRAPGVRIDVDENGTSVDAPAADVEVDEEEVDVQAPATDVEVD